MDRLTFFAKMVELFVWPVALFGAAFLLRNKIKDLLPLITKIKAGPFEMELKQIREEVKAVKETQAAVVNALDEKDPPSAPGKESPSEPPPADPEPSDDELSAELPPKIPRAGNRVGDSPASRIRVLGALGDSRFAMRSLAGIAADTGFHAASARLILGILAKQGLVTETRNGEGARRFLITPYGSQTLALARASKPTTRPGKIGEM